MIKLGYEVPVLCDVPSFDVVGGRDVTVSGIKA